MTVQIVRFKDGIDVICGVNHLEGEIEITNPMMFEIRSANLVLQQWLPLAIMKGNSVTINDHAILCTMEPNDAFAEYYVETVRKMDNILKKEKSMDTSRDLEEAEELLKSLIEMETTKDALKH